MRALLATTFSVDPTYDWTVKAGDWTFGIEETHLGAMFEDPDIAAKMDAWRPPTVIHVGPTHFRTSVSAPIIVSVASVVLIAVLAVVALVVARRTPGGLSPRNDA